jgi:lysozyme family protein
MSADWTIPRRLFAIDETNAALGYHNHRVTFQALSVCRGKVNQKVHPLPGSLSTPMSPP